MKELPIQPNLFRRTIAGTGEVFECADRNDGIVIVCWLMVCPAFPANPQPGAITGGNVLELRLAQCEARGCLHLCMSQLSFQKAAPTASDIEDVPRTRYSGTVEVVIDLAPLGCQ